MNSSIQTCITLMIEQKKKQSQKRKTNYLMDEDVQKKKGKVEK